MHVSSLRGNNATLVIQKKKKPFCGHVLNTQMYEANILWRFSRRVRRYFFYRICSEQNVLCMRYKQCACGFSVKPLSHSCVACIQKDRNYQQRQSDRKRCLPHTKRAKQCKHWTGEAIVSLGCPGVPTVGVVLVVLDATDATVWTSLYTRATERTSNNNRQF